MSESSDLSGSDLKQVHSRRAFRTGPFPVAGQETLAALDLGDGETMRSGTA
jgi:hypothetical protein